MGDEEDGESNDARNSLKKRKRGTILKQTHRRKYEGDEESDDARYSIKRRRRGQSQGGETINHRQTHSNTIHRIDYFGPQLLSHYYIKMRRRISRRHGDGKQARENRFLFPRKPETEVDRENPFLYHPNRASKEEEWRTQTGSGRVRTPKRS